MSPLHDYVCGCGNVAIDQYRSVDEGAQANPPYCPDCGRRMGWIPQVQAMDAFEPGQEFQVYDGQNRPVLVESYAQMRKLERESAVQAANHEGAPLRFRALHQSKSNMDRNTFGDGPAERPTAEGARKFGLQGATRKLPGEPDVTFGPGVNESNTSALKE